MQHPQNSSILCFHWMQHTTKVLGRVSRILYIDWSYLSAVGLTAKFSDTHKLRKSGNSHFQGIRLMWSYTTACQATVGSTVITQLLTYEYDNQTSNVAWSLFRCGLWKSSNSPCILHVVCITELFNLRIIYRMTVPSLLSCSTLNMITWTVWTFTI